MATSNQHVVRKFLFEGRSAVFESFQQYKTLIVSTLSGLFVLLVILTVVGWAKFDASLYFYYDVGVNDGFGAGVMTIFSGMCFFISGALFISCARLFYLHRDAVSVTGNVHWWFLFAGAGIIYLGFDEIVMIHEYLTSMLAQAGAPKLFGIDLDLYIFAFYGVAALVIMIKLMPSIYHYRRAIFPLAAMIAFFVLSEAVDFIPWDELSSKQQSMFGPLEEMFKTMGAWSAVLYAELLLENVVAEIKTRFR